MKEELLQFFRDHQQTAFLISIGISILVAVIGIIPSFFITAANIMFFGFSTGLLVSFLGEAIGAMIAFILYRNGFRKYTSGRMARFPQVQNLLNAENREAFLLIFSLRLIPFVPSGIVTFTAAIGRVSAFIFFVSSSLGKIPALLLEAYSVDQVSRFEWQGKIILLIAGIACIYIIFKQVNNSNTHNQ